MLFIQEGINHYCEQQQQRVVQPSVDLDETAGKKTGGGRSYMFQEVDVLTDTPHNIKKTSKQTQLSERRGYLVIPSRLAIYWVLLSAYWDIAESGNHALGAPFLLSWILRSEQLLDILERGQCRDGGAGGGRCGIGRRTLDTVLSLPWFCSAGGRKGAKIVGSKLDSIGYWLRQVYIVGIIEN